MTESLDMLILNSAAAPQINWVMVIAGVLLLGFSLFMFFKLKK